MRKIRFAEWVSLIVSGIVVLAVVVYLVLRFFESDGELVKISIKVVKDQAAREGERWLVPVEIENMDARTVQKVKLEWASGEYELDYLPGKGKEKIYLFLGSKAEMDDLKIRPVGYMAE